MHHLTWHRTACAPQADVFSFAVVMYEMVARSMLVLTHLKGPNGFQTPDHYAAAVARHGYRPQRPQGCSDQLWQLISACWCVCLGLGLGGCLLRGPPGSVRV